MALIYAATVEEAGPLGSPGSAYAEVASSHTSAVAWGAIVAGAVAAAALSLILLMLGVGLGLSTVSPWANYGASAVAFGVSTILWVTVTQLLACAMGGYIAGRLRTRWVGAQADEIYFRDTAHGFLAWAVASLATAALLTSAIGSIVGAGAQAGASVAGGAMASAAGAETSRSEREAGPLGYYVDSLFRTDLKTETVIPAAPLPEVARIFTNSVLAGPLPAEDVRYLGGLVTQRTGLSRLDAEKRVTDIYASVQIRLAAAQTAAKEAADKARKASSHAALWLFISLLIGAFIASLAATLGGRQRDA